jgi:tetratricopeptide (TPR) repeat protein
MMMDLEKLHNQANNAAVAGDYKKAIALNEEIISKAPQEVDAFLRLGFAYLQIGPMEEAKKAYKKALKIEPMNQIARNNLDKIRILEKKGGDQDYSSSQKKVLLDPNLFLNIIGKTKEVSLVNIGQADVLANLKVGEKVILKGKKRRLEVRNKDGLYIGALPDDVSKRLIFFLDNQSDYAIFVKSASKNNVDVFVREEKKGRKVKEYISFPKNIQDDLKTMIDGGEEEHNSEEEEEHEETSHVDLDQLADEVDTNEFFEGVSNSDHFEDEE